MSKTVLLSLLVGCMSFGAVQAMDPSNVQRAFRDPSTYAEIDDFEVDIIAMLEQHNAKDRDAKSDEKFKVVLRTHLAACSEKGRKLSMSLPCFVDGNISYSLESYLLAEIQETQHMHDQIIGNRITAEVRESQKKKVQLLEAVKIMLQEYKPGNKPRPEAEESPEDDISQEVPFSERKLVWLGAVALPVIGYCVWNMLYPDETKNK